MRSNSTGNECEERVKSIHRTAYTDRPVFKPPGEWCVTACARTLCPVGRTNSQPAGGNDERRIKPGTNRKRPGLQASDGTAGSSRRRAAIGLATVDTIDADSGQRVLPTDASAQRGPGYAVPAAIPAPADTGARGELDPVLNRPDMGKDHHG
jgi:hypothetical protein